MNASPAPAAARRWYITERGQEYEGEARANLFRLVGVFCFYGIHLLHHWTASGRLAWLQIDPEAAGGEVTTGEFHFQVTMLAVAWCMLATGVHACLTRRFFPSWLGYAATAGDLFFLTAVLYLANGPRSPLVVGYFLILILATLRFSVGLVRFATLGAIVGYVCLLGVAKWPETFGRGSADLRVPRYSQLMFLAALCLAGMILGQVVRRIRQAAFEFAQRST